jgi:sulfide:quinone oxidoreductase
MECGTAASSVGGMPTNVLIAGGGPAGLEAALALHRFAGDRVTVTLLAPESDYTYRPLSVLSPFAAGEAKRYPLERIATEAGFTHVRGRLRRVDALAHTVETATGESLGYDTLLMACGARPMAPFVHAITFTGSINDQARLHGIVQDVEDGYLHSVAFVVPSGRTWALPLYELAFMLAERAYTMCARLEVHVVTPAALPLEVFGPDVAGEVAELLSEAGIIFHAGTDAEVLGAGHLRLLPAGETLEVDRIITSPRLEGPAVPGLPYDSEGFLSIDAHARVRGVPDIYAAGDITDYPIKQGGIACQHADAAAAHIAASAGARVEATPFAPVLRGTLRTERWARFLRRDGDEAGTVADHALWWPPAKIAGRELAGCLQVLDDEAGRRAELPVAVGAGVAPVEVLSVRS